MKNEKLSNNLDDQNFANKKYDQLKITWYILLNNSCDAHLSFSSDQY